MKTASEALEQSLMNDKEYQSQLSDVSKQIYLASSNGNTQITVKYHIVEPLYNYLINLGYRIGYIGENPETLIDWSYR